VAVRNGKWSERAMSRWRRRNSAPNRSKLLAELPHPLHLEVEGFGPVVPCHGTPRGDEEVVLVDIRLEKWTEVFAGLDSAVHTVVCGHTHMPFVRLVDRRLVINPGSVGMPYGRPGGARALLRGGQVSLRHTPVDIDAAIAAVVAGSSYPDRLAWTEEYLRSANSDADALRAFGPRDGRVVS
jgi:predicted phosphodiesterase